MAAKNGVILTSAASNGTMVQSGYQNGTQIFGAGGGMQPFRYEDAGVVFTISNLGVVSLTFNDTYTYTATYRDGDDLRPSTNEIIRRNNVSITVPPGYSNTGGDPVTGVEMFTQPAVGVPSVTMVSITDGTLFTNSYRVTLNGEITDDSGLDVSKAGFFVYKGDTDNPNVVERDGTEVTQSDVLGEFNQTYSTMDSNTKFSVIAYADNVLGKGISGILQYTSDTIIGPYTQTTWTASGGGITIAANGDITVLAGNAASTDFPTNAGTHTSCGSETVTVSGTVEVPATGYSNPGADVPITTTADRNSSLPTFDKDSYNGVVKVSQGGTATATNGNASAVTINSQTPSGENTGASNRDVVVNITVTASSSFCNSGETFTIEKTVTQSGIPPVVTTLDISPNKLTFNADAQSTLDPQPTWVQTGGDSTAGLTLTTNPVPSWISSTNNVANPLTGTPNEITITVQENTTDAVRSTTLTWATDDGFASDTIEVTQNAPTDNHATTGTINANEAGTSTNIEVTYNTTTLQIPIKSNGDFELNEGTDRGTNIPGWTLVSTSGSGNQNIEIKGNNNTTSSNRTGTLTLTSTNAAKTVLASVTFTQTVNPENE